MLCLNVNMIVIFRYDQRNINYSHKSESPKVSSGERCSIWEKAQNIKRVNSECATLYKGKVLPG